MTKHLYPLPLISFRKLQGGQFGTLDVAAIDRHAIQLALGSDFVQMSRPQWVALRGSLDRFFGTEGETVVVTQKERIVEDPFGDVERDEELEVEATPEPPRPPPRGKRAPSNRRPSAR